MSGSVIDLLPRLHRVEWDGPCCRVVEVERTTLDQRQEPLPTGEQIEFRRMFWAFDELCKGMAGGDCDPRAIPILLRHGTEMPA